MDPKLAEHPRYREARRRVKALRGFYGHALTYALVVGALAIVNAVSARAGWWVQWTAIGWGIGLLAHGLSVLAHTSAFGRDWEERKIREYLERHGSR